MTLVQTETSEVEPEPTVLVSPHLQEGKKEQTNMAGLTHWRPGEARKQTCGVSN